MIEGSGDFILTCASFYWKCYSSCRNLLALRSLGALSTCVACFFSLNISRSKSLFVCSFRCLETSSILRFTWFEITTSGAAVGFALLNGRLSVLVGYRRFFRSQLRSASLETWFSEWIPKLLRCLEWLDWEIGRLVVPTTDSCNSSEGKPKPKMFLEFDPVDDP